jgi:8-oxo-dGTP pyrophosphatase MutT (NUDIX family)
MAAREGVIRAAGGVVWRKVDKDTADPGIEVAVIHRPRYDDWTLPKGKLAPNESELEGAVREVAEETGLRVAVGRPLGVVRYMKSTGNTLRPKVVRYWSMRVEGGSFFPNREVDELRWVSLAQAHELLTHAHDRELLERFVRGPAATGCVLLVRHATAGSSSEWTGDDRQRPLDELGWAQAEELVRLLARFEVGRIVSADYLRCTQTVQPLSEAIGIHIEEERPFAEDGYPGNEDHAITLVRDYARSLITTAVCSQGDVIPDLLERLAANDHIDLPTSSNAKKGSVWALFFDGDRLFSGEYFPPPTVLSG